MSAVWNHAITVGDLAILVGSMAVSRIVLWGWNKVPDREWDMRK